MASQKLNLTVDQGTDFSETLIAKNADGTVQDVTGFSAAGQIRKSYTSDTATNFTVSFGDAAKGEVIISLARAQTSSLPASRYVYDVELTSAANKRSRLAEGQVTVTQEVTREGAVDFVTEVKITDPQDGAFLIYESANTNWVDSTQIRATSNTVIDVTGTLEADGFSGTGSVTITDFIDDDSFGTANNTNIATSESVKAYVDATSAGKDALAELVDTNITSASSGQFLIHDGTDSFDNKTISGDIAITNQGVASITAGSIINADVNASAGIEISKTALAGGTGITLSGNTLSLTANSALTNLGGDSANTTHILRKDGTFIRNFTASTGLELNSDNQFSLSTGAALTNLGYQDNQTEFLRRDGAWTATKQYYGSTGITITPNSNTEFQSGKDAIALTSGAALTDLGGSTSSGSTSTFLNERGQFITTPDTDTVYVGGTGITIDGASGSNIIELQPNAALSNLGGQLANNDLSFLFLSANGSFIRPVPILDAGAGLTLTANTSLATNSVFSVNTNLSHVVGTGALNSGSITSGFGDINVGANTVTAGSLDINGSGDVSGNLTVHGNFTVNGTETVVNSTTLSVDDKNVVLGSVDTPTDTTADGGGITLKGATDKTINWVNSTDSWTSSEHFALASGKQLRIAASSSLSSPDSAVRIETGGDGGSLFIFGYDSNHYIDFNSGGGSLYIGDTGTTDYASIYLADGFKTIGGTTEIFSPNFGADVLPILSLHRNSSSPATSDKLGVVQFNGEDSAGNKTEYASIHSVITSPTSGAEFGSLAFNIMNNGTPESPVMTLFENGLRLHNNNDLLLTANSKIQFTGNTGLATETTLYCETPSSDRAINLPDASGTVVLKDSTDTLTNKSIDAGQLTGTIDDARIPDVVTSAVQTAFTTSTLGGLTMTALGTTTGGAVVFREGTNNGTNAIKLQAPAQVDGAGSFGTLDITFPNSAGTMALTSDLSSFITASSSDTLTNKSISGEQINSGTIADARIAAASVTQHQGSITGTGALNAGSITSGFGNIDIGANTVTAGATTINGELTVNSDTLKLTSTTASSTVEHPSLELYRNGGTGSADLGAIKFFGNNNADPLEKFQYAGIYASVQSGVDGAEQGSLAFSLGHGGAQEDPAMTLFSYGLQMGYGNPILMSYSNGYQQFFSPNAAQKSFKLNAFPNATVANGAYDIYLPDVEGGTLAVIDSDKAFTAGATTVNGALTVNNTAQSITDTTTNSTTVYGPTIELYRDGGDGNSSLAASMVQSDKLGAIDFYGNNDAGTPEKIKYAKIFSSIYEETDGAESGRLSFSVINAGTHTEGAQGSSILDLEPDVAQFNQTVRIKSSVNDAGVQATPTPILELYQEDGPTADDGDHLGEIQFTAYNDNGYSPAKHKYAGIHAEIIDESNATEDGSLHFTCIKAGTEDNTVLTLNGSGSTLFSDLIAPLTIKSNTTDADLIITNSLDSADASPIIKLHREAGPNGHADGDDLGKLEFHGTNDRGLSSGGPEDVLFGSMFTEVVDSSDGTEDGQIKFTAIKAGSATDVLTLNGSGSTLTGSLEVTGGVTASQTLVNAVTDTSIDATEFASYSGKKVVYTGGAGTVILADAVSGDLGKGWTLVNAGTGAITIDRATNSQTIKLLNGSAVSAGSANLTLATGGVIEITCTAADNYIAFGSGIS